MSPRWCRRSRPLPGHHGVSAALEFAVQVLKVKEIVVMGHGMCGGCKAALTQDLHGGAEGRRRLHRRLDRLLDEARAPVAARTAPRGARPNGRWNRPGLRSAWPTCAPSPASASKERERRTAADRRVLRDLGWGAAFARRAKRPVRTGRITQTKRATVSGRPFLYMDCAWPQGRDSSCRRPPSCSWHRPTTAAAIGTCAVRSPWRKVSCASA
jgi:hypothetical protein